MESDEGEQTEDECDDVIGADKPLYRADGGLALFGEEVAGLG